MMKVTDKATKRRLSRHGERFYTQRDMAIIKHDAAIRNAEIKRGDVSPNGNNHMIKVCGCGVEGCFIHTSYPNK